MPRIEKSCLKRRIIECVFGGGFWFNVAQHAGRYMGKLKTTAFIFELPQKLGIIQQVGYELPPHDRCPDGEKCPYEGWLVVEGCRRGVCLKYRVLVHSFDRKNWIIEGFRRERVEWGGCIPQAAADALWELSGQYDIGVWYDYRYTCLRGLVTCTRILEERKCGVTINGVRLPMPYYCRSVEDCVERILEDYKREVEKMKEPPQLSSHKAEELLRKYPELEAFGVDWVKAWAPHARERLVEIAEVLRRYPWMMEVVKKRPLNNLNPYTVEVYVARDGSVACLSLNQVRTYCAQNGVVKAVKLGLEFSRYEVYEGKKRVVYRPKGLLVFAAVGKEYVKIL
jgi:hypothetical protein